MSFFKSFTFAYTLLFCYVIAAILFWGYSLNKQSNQMYILEKEKLEQSYNDKRSEDYNKSLAVITNKKNRRTNQYLGEGGTLIFIALLATILVYLAYYKQLRLSKLQKNFMLSITHELKTPIAGIKLNMQTLEKRKLDEVTQTKLVNASVKETNRLDDLCNNILAATQLENSKEALYHDQVNLHTITTQVIKAIQSRYENAMFQLNFFDESFTIKADNALWKLVISNLLENARKYGGNEQPIEINLLQASRCVVLQIKDSGIGIADSEKKKIFEKFYRIGNEKTRSSKGTGLGLYIVKKIVRLYKYDISVKNNIPRGSTFEIEFKT